MEVSCMRKETEQEVNEVEGMPSDDECSTVEDTKDA
jgi:hypothetical protein